MSLRRTWEWMGSRSAIRVIHVVVLLVTLTVIWLARQQSEIVACNARYNAASADYDRDRVAAAQRDREAHDAVLRALRSSPERLESELDRYFAQRAESDAQRANAPVVPPPADLCR